MRADTLRRLDDDFQKHPVTVAGQVPLPEVVALEQQAGFSLPQDYKDFVARYGGSIVGPYSVYGLRAADAMGDDETSALEVTQRFRNQQWRGTEAWLVISTDHAGNPIGLDKSGKVWISDHDAGVVEVIANSFEEYLRKRCLKMTD
jgi:hypothetical protein